MVTDFRELLANHRLDHLIVRSRLGIDDFRLRAKLLVFDVESDGGIFKNGASLEHDVVTDLAGSADSNLDSVVRRFQIVTRLCGSSDDQTDVKSEKQKDGSKRFHRITLDTMGWNREKNIPHTPRQTNVSQ